MQVSPQTQNAAWYLRNAIERQDHGDTPRLLENLVETFGVYDRPTQRMAPGLIPIYLITLMLTQP